MDLLYDRRLGTKNQTDREMSQERQKTGGGEIPNMGNDANESEKNIFSVSMAAVHAVEHALVSDAPGDGAGKGETSSVLDLSHVPREQGSGCFINIGDLEARDLAVRVVFCGRGVVEQVAVISDTLHSKNLGSCRLLGETNLRLN